MEYIFNGSEKPTLGVEIELQIIDPDHLDLAPHSEKIVEICNQQNIGRVKTEIHQSMVEIDSEISQDIKQCAAFLRQRLIGLNEIVETMGLQLAVTGTHPFQQWSERRISNSDRHQNLHEKFQWLARRMNVYGMHVHVGVPTGDRALRICEAMVQYLPYLLALSANSPFWQGIDTGMQSSRVNILDAFPLGGLPLPMACWNEFEYYCNTLNQAGAIRTFKDLYWYVRPNLLYGTIEVRVCDAMSTLPETLSVVAMIQCLIAKINEELDQGRPSDRSKEHYWIAPENQWIAARDGLEGFIITDLRGNRKKIADEIQELITHLEPTAQRLNCLEELNALQNIIKNGNGAQRQRVNYQETGSLKTVVAKLQKEFISSFQSNLS